MGKTFFLPLGMALASACLPVRPALADTHIISQSGNWEAYEGKSDDGTQLCGMDTSTNNNDGDDMDVKYYDGDTVLTVQLYSNGWKISDGTINSQLEIKFDNDSWHVDQLTGFHLNDGTPGLEFTIAKNNANDFISDFATSNAMEIDFTDTNIDNWNADLSGTQDVVSAFKDCIRDLP